MVRALFRRWGLAHRASEVRNRSFATIPRAGGIAIVISYLAAYLCLLAVPLKPGSSYGILSISRCAFCRPPALSSSSDWSMISEGLEPWHKLAGEIVAAAAAYLAGIHIQGLAGYGMARRPGGTFRQPSSGSSLAPTRSILSTAWTDSPPVSDSSPPSTTLIAALLQHNTALALATVPLAGCLLGFIRYNFNPATIFLGDCGSLFVGFLLGCYAVVWSQKAATHLGHDGAAHGAFHSAAGYGGRDRPPFPTPPTPV